MYHLDELRKSPVWKYFLEITQVPRPTFHEEKIKAYLLNWADQNNFTYQLDDADNIVIQVPASKGFEDRPVLALQAHKDMVCEKNNDVTFDFLTQGLNLKIDGEWLKAEGTTLGADNGMGIAVAMAIATDAQHPALEILITASEERGLVGANNLSPHLLTAKRLINLDTEDWGEVFIGCAGSINSKLSVDLETQTPDTKPIALKLDIKGLQGGHSGCDIHLNRLNAIKVLGHTLNQLSQSYHYTLAFFTGGNLPNAIPREATATILIAPNDQDCVEQTLQSLIHEYQQAYKDAEPLLALESEVIDLPAQVYTNTTAEKLMNLVLTIPSGVLEMNASMPGLVKTSNNLASIKHQDNQIIVTAYTRSDNDLCILQFVQSLQRLSDITNVTLQSSKLSPGWQPNPNSDLLRKVCETYQNHLGKTPEIKAIHAGLECGAIYKKYPEMDMVSIGPTIRGAHSPDERVLIPSVNEFYTVVKNIIKAL